MTPENGGIPRGLHPSPSWARFHTYDTALLVLLLGLGAMMLASISRPQFATAVHSNGLSVAIISAALLIALGTSYVALGEFVLYGRISSLYVCLAFAVFAASEVGLGLHPVLAGYHSDVHAPYGWALLRMVGGALLLAAALQVDGMVAAYRRVRVLFAGLLLALGVGLLASFWIAMRWPSPLYGVPQGGLQLATASLFAAASILFWRTARVFNRVWLVWLSLSLSIATFAQIQYAIRGPRAGVVQSGDVLWLVFFTGILLALAAEWSRNYRHLRWQARELEALHALMRAPVIENVPALVDHIVRIVADTFGTEARLVLADREGPREVDGDSDEGGSAQPSTERSRPFVGSAADPSGKVVLGVPLGSGAQRLGVLAVFSHHGAEFTVHDVNLLRAFGAQAAVLLDRAFLYEEVAAGAVLQERSRLAREIHDGLAQHLAFLKMRVAWLKRSPNSVGVEQLSDIEGVLETALIEARHAITTLRAQPEGASMMDAITDYAEEFGQVSGIKVSVTIDGMLPSVGPKVRVELLRVVQEALNNVRKHAHAQDVRILIGEREGGIAASIEDTGAGFDATRTLEGHFGLEIMRERAESVGGTIEIDSREGSGTRVSVWVPRSEMEKRRPDWVVRGQPSTGAGTVRVQ